MLKQEVKVLWKAIDKIVLEGKHLSPHNRDYQKYMLAKSEMIKESYVIRKILGDSSETLQSGYNLSENTYVRSSKNILTKLARNNKALAETLLTASPEDKKLLQLESLLFGDSVVNLLSESENKDRKVSVGLSLAEAIFASSAKVMIDIAKKLK